MGIISNSINRYLSDNRRFADLFNGICFRGETVVRAEELLEDSQVYYDTTGTAAGHPAKEKSAGASEKHH